jgi:hypothetical protein
MDRDLMMFFIIVVSVFAIPILLFFLYDKIKNNMKAIKSMFEGYRYLGVYGIYLSIVIVIRLVFFFDRFSTPYFVILIIIPILLIVSIQIVMKKNVLYSLYAFFTSVMLLILLEVLIINYSRFFTNNY